MSWISLEYLDRVEKVVEWVENRVYCYGVIDLCCDVWVLGNKMYLSDDEFEISKKGSVKLMFVREYGDSDEMEIIVEKVDCVYVGDEVFMDGREFSKIVYFENKK